MTVMDKAVLCGMLVEREPGESINEWLDRIESMGRNTHRMRRTRSKQRDIAKHDPHILRRPVREHAQTSMAGMSTNQIAALADQMRTVRPNRTRTGLRSTDRSEPTKTPPQVSPMRAEPALFEVIAKATFTHWLTYARAVHPSGPLAVTWSPKLLASSILRCAIRLGIDPESVTLYGPAKNHEQLYRGYLALIEEAVSMRVSDFPGIHIDDLIESANQLSPGRLVAAQPSMVLSRFESVRQEQRQGSLLISENP